MAELPEGIRESRCKSVTTAIAVTEFFKKFSSRNAYRSADRQKFSWADGEKRTGDQTEDHLFFALREGRFCFILL